MDLGPQGQHAAAALGVYLHFPWCVRKCPYCDFASFEQQPNAIDHEGYADAVLGELEARAEQLEGKRLRTIFIGGGTPSLWQPAQLGRVLRALLATAARPEPGAAPIEITVECNPNSLTQAHATALLDQGVNRLSIGVQSLDSERLRFLGRLHSPAEALAAVTAALRSGMPRVSADLMYGVATSRTAEHWQQPQQAAADAEQLAELGIQHLSCYALTIEPNTRFGELARRKQLPLVSDAIMAESFTAVGEALATRGFERYEISNWAQPGEESQHNLNYWLGHDYLGLGCAAYGTLSSADRNGTAIRYRNAPNPQRYLDAARRGDFSPHEREHLDGETRLRERLMLGLRLRAGFDLLAAAAELRVAAWTARRRAAADRQIARGRLVEEDGWLKIPESAWLFADGIAASLF